MEDVDEELAALLAIGGNYPEDDCLPEEEDVFGDDEAVVADLEPTLEDYMDSMDIDVGGAMHSTMEPLASFPVIALLDVFGLHKPFPSQTRSCRCQVHTNCRVMKTRHLVTDTNFIEWMARAIVEPDAGPLRQRALRDLHQAAWRAMFSAD